MPDRDRPLYAVLIDADNIPAKHADAILKEVRSFGEPALRRVYGDWSSTGLKSWPGKIKALGLVAHQETANTKGKNASDIGLVIDAMDILHSRRFDGFVLVSSDSDFTRLASRIREEGLDVIGIGEKKAPEAFLNVCNRFILIENIVEDDTKPSPTSAKAIHHAGQLIDNVMGDLDDVDGWYKLGPIGQRLNQRYPDFDVRTYGKRKLSDLVKEIKRFKTRKSDNQLEVRRTD